MSDPELVLLTTHFPFGVEIEAYLETELSILAERFRRVFVLPSARADGRRPVPPNVEVVEMPWLVPATSNQSKRALLSPDTVRVAARSLWTPRDCAGYLGAARFYADVLGRQIVKARQLRTFVEQRRLEDALFYDYWFENTTLALALCRSALGLATAVARAHGFDVYDERWELGPVPFRQAKAVGLDAVYPTSDAGARYLAARTPGLRSKLAVQRLGVVDPGQVSPTLASGAVPLILTCARLVPVKRIELVPQVLAALGEPFEWVHIGDGEQRGAVEEAATRLLPPGSWRLLGRIDNDSVLEFYRRHSVQALLSVSSSEGLPVTMMEANSFGVPVVSCDVGGVSEVVNDRTGKLVAADASAAEIADALRACLHDPGLSREVIRAELATRYDARTNYGSFADTLLALHRSHGGAAQ